MHEGYRLHEGWLEAGLTSDMMKEESKDGLELSHSHPQGGVLAELRERDPRGAQHQSILGLVSTALRVTIGKETTNDDHRIDIDIDPQK
jgi:hypothetical protein